MGKRKIWMRLGVTVSLTEDELFRIMEESNSSYKEWRGCYNPDGMDDYDIPEVTAKEFMKRAVVDGESYIPALCFENHIEWWKQEKERRNSMKNDRSWKTTSLEYDPGRDETYIVCGENRRYKIPGNWTPEMMIQALKSLQPKEDSNA